MIDTPPVRAALPRVSAIRLNELREMPYADYLRTPEWRRTRDRKLRAVGYHCERCEAKHGLEVHHLSYERLGDERPSDLEALCHDCHEGHHFNESRRHHLGIYIKLTAEALRQGAYTSLADLSAAVKDLCAAHGIPCTPDRVQKALDALSPRLERPPATPPAPRPDESAPISKTEAGEIFAKLKLQIPFRTMPTTASLEPGAVDAFRRENGLIDTTPRRLGRRPRRRVVT